MDLHIPTEGWQLLDWFGGCLPLKRCSACSRKGSLNTSKFYGMQLVRTFSKLSFGRQVLLCRAVVYVCLVRLALWTLPFSWVLRHQRRVLQRLPLPAHASPPHLIAWAVAAVSCRLAISATCLTQAVAAQLLCAHAGYPTTLWIGAHNQDGTSIAAHAWLEFENQVVIGGIESPNLYIKLLEISGAPK